MGIEVGIGHQHWEHIQSEEVVVHPWMVEVLWVFACVDRRQVGLKDCLHLVAVRLAGVASLLPLYAELLPPSFWLSIPFEFL